MDRRCVGSFVEMLLFYRITTRDPDLTVLSERGIFPTNGRAVELWDSLDVLPDGAGRVLVIDARELSRIERVDGGPCVQVPAVPPAAVQNLDPYRPPQAATAGGGYVCCSLGTVVAVLVIFRRGVWDFPKGTRAPGEDIETCARREVREEVGIDGLDVTRPIGSTQHGYSRGGHYVVKTTHWYLMQTADRSFEPDRQEGIERVARARWEVARRHLGYENLRRHMDRVENTVRATVLDTPGEPGTTD